MALALPCSASTLVMAAVSVVLPWSTWPMVPMLTWGFVRLNAVDNSLFNISSDDDDGAADASGDSDAIDGKPFNRRIHDEVFFIAFLWIMVVLLLVLVVVLLLVVLVVD